MFTKYLHARAKSNEYKIVDNIVHVKLTNSNDIMFCDINDWNEMKKHCWSVDNEGYASTANKFDNYKKARFHDLLFIVEKGLVIDYINRNKLNNCRSNLRITTYQVNIINGKLRNDNTSGYKGVYWSKQRSKWIAQICINSKVIGLGGFENKQGAIQARMIAEEKYFKPLMKEVV